MYSLYLPKEVTIDGKSYKLNSDFRVGIRLMQLFEDRRFSDDEKILIAIRVLFFDKIPKESIGEAAQKMVWFLDGGGEENGSKGSSSRRLYSWNQDLRFIISAVDKTIGFSTRGAEYLHWWDFLSAFSEIGDSSFSTIVSQRQIKARGKQTDEDRQWWLENIDIAELHIEHTDEEQQAIDKFNKLLKVGEQNG